MNKMHKKNISEFIDQSAGRILNSFDDKSIFSCI